MAAISAAPARRLNIGPVHLLLGAQTVVIILGTINRLGTLTLGYVAPNQFLRWVDFLNMLAIAPASLLIAYLLKKHLEQPLSSLYRGTWHTALNIAFFAGVYLTAVSYGTHEFANYLHARFCPAQGPAEASETLCAIIIYNDDEFSHFTFFAGFVLVNAVLLLTQVVFPFEGGLTGLDTGLLVVNALFIALGIFVNLAFEVIGLDLYVVVLLTLLTVYLWLRRGPQPMIIYYGVAYVLGVIATVIYKVFFFQG